MIARRSQRLVFASLALVTIACVVALALGDAALFAPFLGPLNPVLVAAAAMGVGMACSELLLARSAFVVVEGRKTYEGVAWAVGLATLFAVVVVTADSLFLRYPKGLNVPPPQALLFYPAMAFIVEVFFHLAPLALLSLMRLRLGRCPGHRGATLPWLLLVALIEPTVQSFLEVQPHAFTWLHVFAFNLAQLCLFALYDFASMLAMRLTYYLYWHILWGTARLHLLF